MGDRAEYIKAVMINALPLRSMTAYLNAWTTDYPMKRGSKKGQVRQCLGFCTSDFRSLLVYESAVNKPKHCLTCSFLHPLPMTDELSFSEWAGRASGFQFASGVDSERPRKRLIFLAGLETAGGITAFCTSFRGDATDNPPFITFFSLRHPIQCDTTVGHVYPAWRSQARYI